MKKVVITGGGTGGHVFPAITIADELKERGYQVLYVGSSKGFEAKIVPERGYAFYTVRSGSIKNQSLLKKLRSLIDLFLGIFWALKFLKKEKPLFVIGVGGYVSVPTSLAAYLLRIPIYLQEQNASVGIANRFLGLLAKKVFLGFEQAKKSFSKSKCLVTGNPLRKEFLQKNFEYNSNPEILLVMGGSQGARAINEAIANLLPKIKSRFPNLQILHQTGQTDFHRIHEIYQKTSDLKFEVIPFITDTASAYQKASLIVARSGALTASEIIRTRRPTLFVPYPRRGQNDQTTNAYFLESFGAAKVVEQGNNFEQRLWTTLEMLLNKPLLETMHRNYEKIPSTNATVAICDFLDREVK